jgi:hypothetical protein
MSDPTYFTTMMFRPLEDSPDLWKAWTDIRAPAMLGSLRFLRPKDTEPFALLECLIGNQSLLLPPSGGEAMELSALHHLRLRLDVVPGTRLVITARRWKNRTLTDMSPVLRVLLLPRKPRKLGNVGLPIAGQCMTCGQFLPPRGRTDVLPQRQNVPQALNRDRIHSHE